MKAYGGLIPMGVKIFKQTILVAQKKSITGTKCAKSGLDCSRKSCRNLQLNIQLGYCKKPFKEKSLKVVMVKDNI